jgi:iron-sulfur cluster repair protein YtfE (RIC family)
MNIRETMGRMLRQRDDNNEATPAPDALTLIKTDHEEAKALFARFLDSGTPAAQRRTALTQVLDALTIHTNMEEQIFYPALRKAGGSTEKNSVLEAFEEHASAKDLIAKIRALPPRDETLTAKVTVLKEMVEHHVEEEESQIFSEARRVLGNKLEALGAEMQRFKERAKRGENTGRTKTTTRKSGTASTRKASTRKTATRKSAAKKRTTATRGGKKTRR